MVNRPDVVLTLVDTDLSTMVTAMQAKDRGLIRMQDGSTPTAVQLEHILSATAEDLEAAKDMWKLHMEQVEYELDHQLRINALVDKYRRESDGAKTPLRVLASRMTPEDRSEWDRLWDELGDVIAMTGSADQ